MGLKAKDCIHLPQICLILANFYKMEQGDNLLLNQRIDKYLNNIWNNNIWFKEISIIQRCKKRVKMM